MKSFDLLLCLSPLLLTPLIICLYLYLHTPSRNPKKSTLIITHTPANHSPRALSHALSLLQSTPNPVIFLAQPPLPESPNLTFIPIPPVPKTQSRSPFSLFQKLLRQTLSLTSALHEASFHSPTHIILNSPPILPILPLLLLLRPFLFPNSHLTIDWHNLAYTLMTVNNVNPSLVTLAKLPELLLARMAHNHWAVSKALASYLVEAAAIDPTVVYDRPRLEMSLASRQRMANSHNVLKTAQQLATKFGPSYHIAKLHAPIVVTSTSWTPDEDFSLLFSAIAHWETCRKGLVIIITGRGPMRKAFERRIEEAALQFVAVWFVWVSMEHYPPLVAAADVGLSLHASSSKLDLPMKVVDMLGCGIPVVARAYHCLKELIREGQTGLLFHDAEGLVEGVEKILWGGEGAVMRKGIAQLFQGENMAWQTSWERDALPTLLGIDRNLKAS